MPKYHINILSTDGLLMKRRSFVCLSDKTALKFYNQVAPKYKIAYPGARCNLFKNGIHELISATK